MTLGKRQVVTCLALLVQWYLSAWLHYALQFRPEGCFFLIVCLFLSKLLFCTLCAKVLSMQGSQNVHNGHLSDHTLPEKAKSFHLLMGFQYTEAACDQVRVKYWKMVAVWMPRSSALFVFAVLFIELNLLLIQMDPHILKSWSAGNFTNSAEGIQGISIAQEVLLRGFV